MRDQACQGALTQKQTFRGGGALEGGDLRLPEDGSERGGALSSDEILLETVNERRGEDGETEGVSRGADTKANAFGAAGAHFSEVTALPLSPSHSLVMPSAV